MAERALAPRPSVPIFAALQAIFGWPRRDRRCRAQPLSWYSLDGAGAARRPVVSAGDVERLLPAMPVEYRAAVLLGALGLLQGGVFGLRVGAIDFLRRTLTVRATLIEVEGNFSEGSGKTQSSRHTISVPDRNIDKLSAHLARTGRTA